MKRRLMDDFIFDWRELLAALIIFLIPIILWIIL